MSLTYHVGCIYTECLLIADGHCDDQVWRSQINRSISWWKLFLASKSPSSDMWFESLHTFLVVSSTHMYLVCVAVQSVYVDASSTVTERVTDGND